MNLKNASPTQADKITASVTAKKHLDTIVHRNKIKVFLWKIAGLLCVALAIVGAILPILPTTIFLIMATTCFAKSSPKLQQLLLKNKTFGPIIQQWQQHRSIPSKTKKTALFTMLLSVVWSGYLLQNMLLTLLVFLLILGPFLYVYKLPVR